MYGLGSGPSRKISVGPLEQHHRRHRAELLAALDVVEPLEVLGPARVRHQRAVAQGARAELAAPVEPRDHAVGGEHVGHLAGEVARGS